MPNKLNITKELDDIATDIYKNVLSRFTKQSPEYYSTASRIRQGLTDSYFYIAQAEGSSKKGINDYEWNYARKFLNGLKAMLIFAQKQKMVGSTANIVKKLDTIIKEVDGRIKIEIVDKKKLDAEELKPWLDKYKLWKEMNKRV